MHRRLPGRKCTDTGRVRFSRISSISIEARRTGKDTPENIAQASRISGVSPADVSALLIFLGR
ncbi:MAG: hypothetical protein ACLUOS_19520 [Odoribacter splanchnicus]